MDTLKRIRPNEDIRIVKVQNDNVTAKLEERQEEIIIFTGLPHELLEATLSKIPIDDTGFAFFEQELCVDPLNNKMVPRHRIANDDEIETMSRKHIKTKMLPVLQMLDPIRRWYNFPRNSVVAIERGCDDVYFRRVE